MRTFENIFKQIFIHTTATTNESDTVYLTKEEIEKIESVPLESNTMMAIVRDMFLSGYYTGQRFSDWPQVNKSRAHGSIVQMLTIYQEKTQAAVTIPIQAKLQAILDRYPTGIPAFTNQFFNREIKELAKMAGIKQVVSVSHYRGRKLVLRSYEKWQLVSSHTARRSFATNAYLAGIPIIEIMKFTGHKSSSAFMAYIRITGQEAATNYANHPFFTGK